MNTEILYPCSYLSDWKADLQATSLFHISPIRLLSKCPKAARKRDRRTISRQVHDLLDKLPELTGDTERVNRNSKILKELQSGEIYFLKLLSDMVECSQVDENPLLLYQGSHLWNIVADKSVDAEEEKSTIVGPLDISSAPGETVVSVSSVDSTTKKVKKSTKENHSRSMEDEPALFQLLEKELAKHSHCPPSGNSIPRTPLKSIDNTVTPLSRSEDQGKDETNAVGNIGKGLESSNENTDERKVTEDPSDCGAIADDIISPTNAKNERGGRSRRSRRISNRFPLKSAIEDSGEAVEDRGEDENHCNTSTVDDRSHSKRNRFLDIEADIDFNDLRLNFR